jgi:hypothetical protein
MMQLFHLFLSFHILRDIVNKINRYATSYTSDDVLLEAMVGFYLRLRNSRLNLPYNSSIWI